MKIYWGLNSIPELRGLPKAQQGQLWRTCFFRALRLPRVWGSYLGMIVLNAGVLILATQFSFARPGSIGHYIVLVGGATLAIFLANQLAVPAVRPLLAARRAALEPPPARDDTYHVPPAF
ncbi:MAG TPA: hypothetical protein VD886_19930 [Herpetosiphonaceae bacterium]|nr:hypothetical protein [Herpetosiphonaceae bacterium]